MKKLTRNSYDEGFTRLATIRWCYRKRFIKIVYSQIGIGFFIFRHKVHWFDSRTISGHRHQRHL